jgi:hypothetical protein
MTLQIPVGFAQVIHELRMLGDAEPMAVTYGIQSESPGNTVDVAAAQIGAIFAAQMMPKLSDQLNFFSTTLRRGTVTGQVGEVGIAAANTNGGLVGAICPQNTAYLVKKVTAAAGKRNQGRMYLPGVLEAAVTNIGVLPVSDVRTGLRAALAAWLPALIAGADATQMVILHSLGLSLVPAPTIVTSLVLDDLVSTQRRRLRK